MGPVGSEGWMWHNEESLRLWSITETIIEKSFTRVWRKLLSGPETPAGALGGCQGISWEVNEQFERENE